MRDTARTHAEPTPVSGATPPQPQAAQSETDLRAALDDLYRNVPEDFRHYPEDDLVLLHDAITELIALRTVLTSEGYIGYAPSPSSSPSSHSYRLADDDAPTGGPGPGPGAEG